MNQFLMIFSSALITFQEKIKALESQNKTLAAQLRRLHQIVVNGGLRQGQVILASHWSII